MLKYSGSKPKGHGQFANMPQEVEMKEWPKYPRPSEKEIDDTIVGIDEVVSRSSSKRKSHQSNQK